MTEDQKHTLLDGTARASWSTMRIPVRASYARMLRGDIAYLGTYVMDLAQGSLPVVRPQVVLGIWAVARVLGQAARLAARHPHENDSRHRSNQDRDCEQNLRQHHASRAFGARRSSRPCWAVT